MINRLVGLLALIVLLLTSNATVAASMTFSFHQGGFAEGAVVSGVFAGTDLNMDGQLSSFNGEISVFSMTFSGNSLVESFTLGFDALFAFAYDLDGTGIDDFDEGIEAVDDFFGYSGGPGPVNPCGLGANLACGNVFDVPGTGFDMSSEFILVQPVPLPTALLLLFSSTVALSLFGFKSPVT